jgi:uncharacterized membrane protein YadS
VAWIVATTTSLSIALAAIGLETNIGKLTARGFRPAWLGTLRCCLSRAPASRWSN